MSGISSQQEGKTFSRLSDDMLMSIHTNTASLGAQRSLGIAQGKLQRNLRNLSSGYRVNNGADDAAGLAVSEKLRAQIRSMRMAERNAADALSLLQTAEGGMSELGGLLIRTRELAMQAATDTIGDPERRFIADEVKHAFKELDRIAFVTEFNGKKLLDGSPDGDLIFHVGTQNTAGDKLRIRLSDMRKEAMSLPTIDLSTATGARSSLATIDDAIKYVSRARSEVGALSNRLQSTVANLDTTREKLNAARSRIVDADVAVESAQMTKHNILLQANVAVLAQVNQAPSVALSLLG